METGAMERLIPVRIFTTSAAYVTTDDFINGEKPTSWEGFEYDGPVAELKKGRDNLQGAANAGGQNIKTAADITQQDRGTQAGYRTGGDQIANAETSVNGADSRPSSRSNCPRSAGSSGTPIRAQPLPCNGA
jgi:hypothetical protein